MLACRYVPSPDRAIVTDRYQALLVVVESDRSDEASVSRVLLNPRRRLCTEELDVV